MNTKALMALAVAVAMIGSAFAQAAGPQGENKGSGQSGAKGAKGAKRGQQMMGRRGGMMNFDGPVLAQLNLTSAQQSKVKTLKEKLAKEMKTTLEKNRGDREAMRKSLQAVGKQYRDELAKVLTPAQQKQYKTLMKAEMEKRRKEMGNRPGGARRPGTPPPASI